MDEDAQVVVCTGSPRDYASRARLVARLGLQRHRYATVVHPGAHLGSGTTLGAATVVLAGCVTTCDVHVRDHVAVMPHVTLTHDNMIEAVATLASAVTLGGAAHVGTGAYLGARSAVREGVRVGEWSLLGMGSVLLHDLAPRTVAYGVPALPVRAAEVDLPEPPTPDIAVSAVPPSQKEHLS
jgi:acetyltransferase-like isoleucine patch superfamily enzyme